LPNKLKILIIANSTIVFGKELKSELEKKGKEVCLLDFESLSLQCKKDIDTSYSDLFLRYKQLPKLHMFFRLYFMAKLIKRENFDLVNIHYIRWVYIFLLPVLTKSRFVATFYGSDFYRSSNLVKRIQRLIYKQADALTFTNPLTKEAFTQYYKGYEEKSYVCRFGLKTLDYIDKNRQRQKEELRDTLGYSTSKIIVTCGYNATRAQQHKKIIEELVLLEELNLNKIQFVFPMTYGDMLYKEEIKNLLRKSGLDYVVLEEFLYEDDNAYVKLASDIMINLLETDSFSGSMQEFLYANNYVITGSWLPYEVFDKEGIVYYKLDFTRQLNRKLVDVLEAIDQDKDTLANNPSIISRLSSWKNNINNWIDVYEKH